MAQQIKFIELALRAHAIFKTLGARRAAGYLRNKQVSLEDALVLLGLPVRTWGRYRTLIGKACTLPGVHAFFGV